MVVTVWTIGVAVPLNDAAMVAFAWAVLVASRAVPVAPIMIPRLAALTFVAFCEPIRLPAKLPINRQPMARNTIPTTHSEERRCLWGACCESEKEEKG